MRYSFLWCFAAFAALLLASPPRAVPAAAGTPEKLWILVETDRKRLTLYRGTETVETFPIASGAWDTPSPIGSFFIKGRFQTELSGFGTRYLSLSVPWGQYGIHGTNKPASIGGNASHGCIRLRVKDAERLYAAVPDWTKVIIEGGPYGPLGDSLRTLRPGDRSAAVQLAQQRLRQQGYLAASADGVYGAATSRAVIAARRSYGLSPEDVIDVALFRRLGILLFE